MCALSSLLPQPAIKMRDERQREQIGSAAGEGAAGADVATASEEETAAAEPTAEEVALISTESPGD
jgi:hypothetical protein